MPCWQGLVPKVVHLLGQSLKCDKSVVALVLEAMNAQGLKLSMANRLSIPKFKELCNADRIGWDTLLAMSVSDPEISRRRPLPLSASVSAGRAPSQVAWSSSLKLRLRSAEGKVRYHSVGVMHSRVGDGIPFLLGFLLDRPCLVFCRERNSTRRCKQSLDTL